MPATLHFDGELLVSFARSRGRDDGRASFGEGRGDAAAEEWAGAAGDEGDAAGEGEAVEDGHCLVP